MMLRIHEWLTEDGSREAVELGEEDGALIVREGGADVALPMAALERVMERYGKPLADGIPLSGPKLDLGDVGTLYCIRHLARYDIIARDFVVWAPKGGEPLAELARAVSGALVHLARAAKNVPQVED
jgi:hypothetical protein